MNNELIIFLGYLFVLYSISHLKYQQFNLSSIFYYLTKRYVSMICAG